MGLSKKALRSKAPDNLGRSVVVVVRPVGRMGGVGDWPRGSPGAGPFPRGTQGLRAYAVFRSSIHAHPSKVATRKG